MSNNSKLILMSKRNKKTKSKVQEKVPSDEFVIDKLKINEKELKLLKNPQKGQIFIHSNDMKNYRFYRFSGKEWLEIK